MEVDNKKNNNGELSSITNLILGSIGAIASLSVMDGMNMFGNKGMDEEKLAKGIVKGILEHNDEKIDELNSSLKDARDSVKDLEEVNTDLSETNSRLNHQIDLLNDKLKGKRPKR